MTGMRQYQGRYSPGCGARVRERTLVADLQGDEAVQHAFDGYAPQRPAAAPAALARPESPASSQGLWAVITRVVRWLRTLLRL